MKTILTLALAAFLFLPQTAVAQGYEGLIAPETGNAKGYSAPGQTTATPEFSPYISNFPQMTGDPAKDQALMDAYISGLGSGEVTEESFAEKPMSAETIREMIQLAQQQSRDAQTPQTESPRQIKNRILREAADKNRSLLKAQSKSIQKNLNADVNRRRAKLGLPPLTPLFGK